jgi:uncharacterized Zn finger protein (UPF0148 family)
MMTRKGIVREMSKSQVKIDGIGAKFIFLDDFSYPTSENTKINTEAINERKVEMKIKCAKCKKEFEYSKNDVKKHYMKLRFTIHSKKNEMEFVVCTHCQYENYIEEKMLLNKCFICGGFLYEHTDLETANRYIYCPKCKEEAETVKARMTDEQARGLLAVTKMLGITDSQVDEIKEKFDTDYKKQILTDIRNYLLKKQEDTLPFYDELNVEMALNDLKKYAEKLGVEL